MVRTVFVAVLVVLSCVYGSSCAQADMYTDCSDTSTSAERIRGCTLILQHDGETEKNYGIAYSLRAGAYVELRRFSEAIVDCTNLLLNYRKVDPYGGYTTRGMAYVRSGQVDEGLEDFKQAIQLNLNDVTAYNGLGEAYTKKGEYQLALQAYSSAILRKPNDFFAYYARGNVYLIQLKDYAASITDYSKAIELRPNHVDAHFNRAVAYERLGDTAKARQDYVFAAEHGDSEATQVIERMDTTGFPIIIPRFRLR